MKKVKKLVCLALSAVMTAGIMLPANASVFSENKIFVSHFDDFSAWTSPQGSINDLPEGFFTNDGAKHPNRATATGSVVDSATGSRAFAMKNGAAVGYHFDQVYKTGVRSISFDLKMEAPTAQTFWVNGHTNYGNDNPYDYWLIPPLNENGGIRWDYRPYMGISNASVRAVNADWGTVASKETIADNNWHKIEILFDYDKNKAYYYVDGVELGNEGHSIKNKTVYFLNETDKTVYIDNLAIFHGAKAEYAQSVKMCADGDYSVVPLSGGQLKIELSKNVNTVSASDFTVKDSNGAVVSGAVTAVEKSANRATTLNITTGTLQNGVYTLEYTGAANAVEFTAASAKEVESADTEKYTYYEEDFNAYNGGVPAQWVATKSSKKTPTYANDATKGKTLKFESGDVTSYMHKLDESFTSGKLKVEFDMKTSGKGWGIGFIREADYTDEDYEKHLAIGNLTADSDSDDIYTCAKWNFTDPGLLTKSDKKIKTDEWNHISITVNMISEFYEINVNGEEFTAHHPSILESGRWKIFWYDVVKSDDTTLTGQDAYKSGLNGIRLFSDGTNNVEFDNVKIYSDNSNYISEDFNDYTGSWKNDQSNDYYGLPAGYYRRHDIWNPMDKVFNHTEGKNYDAETNPNDKGVILNTYQSSNCQTRVRLVHPITDLKNNAFAIEFDVKPGIRYGFSLYPKEKFYSTSVEDKTGILGSEGIYQDPVFVFNHMGNKIAYGCGDWGETTAFEKKGTAEQMPIDDTKWNHVKVVFDPIKGITAYVGEGENVVESETVAKESVKKYNLLLEDKYNNVAGLGLHKIDQGDQSKAGEPTSIDNLKVYPVNTVTKPSIMDVKSVNIDGAKSVVSGELAEVSNVSKGIELKFTQALGETSETMAEKVKLYKNDGTVIPVDGTLSTDKTTYTMTYKEIPAADTVATLKTSYNIKGASSVAVLDNPVTQAIKFVSGKGDVVITDMQLYKKIASREIGTYTTVPEAWVPATTRNDADASEYKIVITGTNTTGAANNTKYDYIEGIYGTEDDVEILKSANLTKLQIPAEVNFKIEKSLPTISDGQNWKAFIWEDGQKPAADVLK